MNREFFALCALTAISTNAIASSNSKDQKNEEKPNIIFFLTEDLSPHFLALFNNGKGCETPNLSSLASRGIMYPNAYSSAPVSSAARTTLITGCYAPSFEGSFHRHIELNPMPEGLRMFPTYLRRAGYYTINAVKTDYNVILDTEAWDDMKGKLDTWRRLPNKNQPFFMQRSVMTTHESKLLFDRKVYETQLTRHNPDSVYLLPHVPDTKLMRYSYATIYDRIEESDAELGSLIKMLKEDNELDNTIIFFFGDNGGVTPGTKGYTDNVGVQVPLVVYVPNKWQKKMNAESGVIRDDIVSFMDFGPTALNMAGAEIPERMDGRPFLGKGTKNKKYNSTVCYGDRFDELYSFNRSIRKGNFRYERNYQPYQTQSLFAVYRYMQLSFQEWKLLNAKGVLNKAQSRFFEPQGVEELYDLTKDPNELNNLAADPKYRAKLNDLRGDLNKYLLEKCDLGFFPENIIHEEAMENPATYGENNKARIANFMQIADLQQLAIGEAKDGIEAALNSDDDVAKWWGLTDCAAFGKEAAMFKAKAKEILASNTRDYIKSKAMLFLSMLGEESTPTQLKSLFVSNKKDAERLLILNDIAVMVELELIKPFPINVTEVKGENFGIEWRVRYLQSLYDGTSMEVICSKNFGK